MAQGVACPSNSAGLTDADGRSSKKLLRHREDGAALNGAREDALPPELDLEAQAVEGGSRKGMILPFIRLAITFRDIHYYVAMPEVWLCLFEHVPSRRSARNSSSGTALSCCWSGWPSPTEHPICLMPELLDDHTARMAVSCATNGSVRKPRNRLGLL